MSDYAKCPKCERRMKAGRLANHSKNGECERWLANAAAAGRGWTRRMGTCALPGCGKEFLRIHEAHVACSKAHSEELRKLSGPSERRTNPGERLDGDAQLAALKRTELELAKKAEAAGRRMLSPEANHALWLRVLEVAA